MYYKLTLLLFLDILILPLSLRLQEIYSYKLESSLEFPTVTTSTCFAGGKWKAIAGSDVKAWHPNRRVPETRKLKSSGTTKRAHLGWSTYFSTPQADLADQSTLLGILKCVFQLCAIQSP